MTTIPDPRPGVTYDVTYRIVAHENSAATYITTVDVEMFAFEERDGELLFVLTEEAKSDLYDTFVGMIDGTWVDADNPEDHPLIESVE